MLLLIDHLALRARNYEYLIRLFQEWEVRVATSRALKGQPGLPSLSIHVRGTALGQDAVSLNQLW